MSTDWSDNHPRGTAEQRYLNAKKGTGVLVNPEIVASLVRNTDYNIDLVTPIFWETSLLSGYTLASQPGATVAGNIITVLTAGTYEVQVGAKVEATGGVGPYFVQMHIFAGGGSGATPFTWPTGDAGVNAYWCGTLAAGATINIQPVQSGATIALRQAWVSIKKLSN